MKKKNLYLTQEFQQKFQQELKKQLHEHRKKLKLSQNDVANALGVSRDTYQRWEKPSQDLLNIFNILSVLRVLNFSTAEIIEMLGLAPLTPDEIKAVFQDEDMLKSIQSNTIYSFMRKNYLDMNDLTLKKLFFLLGEEYFKRFKGR